MNRSYLLLIITSLLSLVFLGNCSQEVAADLPLVKIPMTTNSNEALEAFEEGLSLSDKFQVTAAAEQFRLAVDLDPQFAMAWLRLAYVSPNVESFLSWVDSASFHSKSVSKAEQLIIKAAEFRVDRNNLRERAVLNELVEAYPGDEMAHLLLGDYYFGVQQYHLAIKSYTNAIGINENMMTPYNQLGYSQRALGNYGEAEKAFKFYIRLNPENPNAYDSYAELLMEMGRYRESIGFYKQTLDIDPGFVSSHIGISCNYCFLGEPDSARARLQILKSLPLSPRDQRRANTSEAISYVYMGNLSEALEILNENLKHSKLENNLPNMATDLAAIGNMNLEMGYPDLAFKAFNESIKLITNSGLQQGMIDNARITHLFNLSRVFSARGEFELAEQTAKKYSMAVLEQKNPLQVQMTYQLNGILALAQEQYATAIEQFEQSNQLNPLNLYRLGEAYLGNGNFQDAEIMFQRAAELNALNSMNQALVLSKTKFKKII